ncbi:hypothetical protein RRG08_016576 [Elysia crispata]|uniref:Uncharacterized protein n=1 Tax=Elysia crispata TaxID=231223 RepID=A0AAE1ASH6_9GAST|nr:hypothetical protein RRG08_016576 [Elysia crispata]
MKTFLIVCLSLALLSVALADDIECISHSDHDPSPSPCEGKPRMIRDRHTEYSFCCADDSLIPLGHRTVKADKTYQYHCRCITNEEWCIEYPLFC